MTIHVRRGVGLALTAVALGSPLASHAALALGRGYGTAMVLAAMQAVAVGAVLMQALPRRLRLMGPGVAATLLGALASGGLLAEAGVSHALLYLGLLGGFAGSLRPGRTSLVTALARRLNPRFHPGMVPYTRAVTAAWCLFFAGQLVTSAVLLGVAPGLWAAFVTTLHAPLVAAMAVGEFLVRRWRWRHQHVTGLFDTIRGVRDAARAARTSRPAAGCPGHSGNATPRPAPRWDSGPGRAG